MIKLRLSLMFGLLLITINCQKDISREPELTTPSIVSEKKYGLMQDRKMNQAKVGRWQKLSVGCSFGPSSISFAGEIDGIISESEERFCLTSDGGDTWAEHSVRGDISAWEGAYNLEEIVMTASGHIYALGLMDEVGGAIFTSFDSGKTWIIDDKYDGYFSDIALAGTDAWIVGKVDAVPVILHMKGRGTWQVIWRGSRDQHLNGIKFINEKDGWGVGADGLILHTNDGGNSWHFQQTPVKEPLVKVAFADSMIGYAVGQHGTILYTSNGGNTWTKQDSGTQANLTRVVAVSPSIAWTVGQKGTVLYTNDAGQHWNQQDIGTQADIYAVTVKGNEVWIATSDGFILRSPKLR